VYSDLAGLLVDIIDIFLLLWPSIPVINAIAPGISFISNTTALLEPLKSSAKPSISVSFMFPPPIEAPITVDLEPSSNIISIFTVLGWTFSPKLVFMNSNLTPCSFANSKEYLILASSGSNPNIPPTNALSVPWPL